MQKYKAEPGEDAFEARSKERRLRLYEQDRRMLPYDLFKAKWPNPPE